MHQPLPCQLRQDIMSLNAICLSIAFHMNLPTPPLSMGPARINCCQRSLHRVPREFAYTTSLWGRHASIAASKGGTLSA